MRCPTLLSDSETSMRAGMWGHWRTCSWGCSLQEGRETSTVHIEYCSWNSVRHQVHGAVVSGETFKWGPKHTGARWHSKKLYNKHEGVKGETRSSSVPPSVKSLNVSLLFGYFTTLDREPLSLVPFVGTQNGCYRTAITEGSRDQAKAKDQTHGKWRDVVLFFTSSSSSSLPCLGGLDELQCQVVAEPVLFL